jgi:hypothetical protein
MKRIRAVPRRAGLVAAAAGIAALAVPVGPPVAAVATPLGAASPVPEPTERLLTPVPITATTPTATSRDRVLATVTHGGHVLTFVAHGAIGTVGVYESAPLGVTPYLTGMRDDGPGREEPTALELYQAVSTTQPPAALVSDHTRRRSSPAKSIVLPSATADELPDGSCEYNDAIQFGSVWALNWHDGIGQQHDLHAELSFFDHINGNIGKLYDANRSSARWFAACNWDHVHGFASIYMIPVSLVNGVPTQLQPVQVGPGRQDMYWSAGGPERWQLLMKESLDYNPNNIRNWAIGGAIDKPLGFVGNGG